MIQQVPLTKHIDSLIKHNPVLLNSEAFVNRRIEYEHLTGNTSFIANYRDLTFKMYQSPSGHYVYFVLETSVKKVSYSVETHQLVTDPSLYKLSDPMYSEFATLLGIKQ